ncbi:uncharacterized protein LOC135956979 [Calliphora vicina]|uniref:uncharacterized protein LOC135956979 n=1 Tax=Calliphora vicina TaxID=7373 RepID=UPI00325C0BC0
MIYLRVSSSLMLIYLLLTLCYNINSAPTHHLTIGVQGNTPTLIVTSSEIGITPETMGSTKKLMKTEYAAKTYKDLDAGKKPIKTKLHKNQSVFNKKDKLQYLAKPLNKQISMEEISSHIMKSQKILKEPREHTSTTTELLKDQETTTEKLQDFKTFTTPATDTDTTRENVEIYKTNLHLTTLPPEQINGFIQLTTTTSTAQPEEVSTTTPQANTDTTSPPPLRPEDVDDLKIPAALSTTLNPKDFDDISTTINYEDATNIATISKALTKMQTETPASVVEKTTQILQDTTVIKTENETDNDSYTQDPVATTENENLLLTTIETKAFTTPTTPADASSTPSLVTLTADNAEATTTAEMLSLPLTMTTTSTEIFVDDDSNNNNDNKNEQQQQHTTIEYTEITTTPVSDKEELDKEAENPAEAESQDNINSDVTLKPQQEHTTQPTDDDFKSTENPLQVISVATTQANLNKQNKTEIETITETENSVVTSTTPLTNEKPQAFTTFQTQQQDFATTPDPTDNPHESSTDTVTTEAVLKLIDLEKHVLKTIDELKQPSALLMAGQHDNGHDGLKNIKKKQLIDKHYVEALLHNKQDVHAKDSIENEKYLQITTQASTTTTSSTSAPSTATAASTKPLLMPIKHGYLGPILMEEKTFHVIHHADKAMTTRNKHLADIEAQLRKGHFVELKAKTDDTETQQQGKDNTNKNTKSFSSMEMQSDQPAEHTELTFGIKEHDRHFQQLKQSNEKESSSLSNTSILDKSQIHATTVVGVIEKSETNLNTKHNLIASTKSSPIENPKSVIGNAQQGNILPSTEKSIKTSFTATSSAIDIPQEESKSATVLSTTVFQVIDSVATKTPMVQANTLFTSEDIEKSSADNNGKQQTESKISDIQIEVYDSTVDSIVASTNFKDSENIHQSQASLNDESSMGKTTKPPIATVQQERFTQYVIDRTETSTQEPINYSTIQVANGKLEPAAIEIHINVSESFGNESEDLEFSYPQSEYINNNNNDRIGEESYDDIKLKIPSNSNNNIGKDLRADEILVVEIIDTDNITDSSLKVKTKNTDELFITDVKELYTTPPPPPPPPPYQNNFDRDSDTIFYISNTEVKVGESLPATNNVNEERKLKLESQFFPANYMASTHPNVNSPEELNAPHHLYEEDIILSSSRNQADSLKIYRNRNEPSPPLDVTYVGESIIEVEQSPDSVLTTTYAPDQQHNVATPQADVIIQPALLPEISIGVPVIGELPPQIELKEIDFMPNEAQLHRSGIYDDNDSSNSNNNIMFNNDIDENTISGGNNNNNHDVDIVNGNSNNNQRVDESSIQYGGDLIDESADGGFDGVEGSYPFGNPATVGKSSSSTYSSAFMTKLRKQQQQQQQPNHVADYAHLYINYGVNNMRKDELSADVKDSGELLLVGVGGGNINVASVNSNEQNITSFRDFLNKASMSNSTIPFMSVNSTQNERMSNATAFSVMEDANDLEDKNTEDIINLISLAIGLFIVILPVVVTCSMFWALRYLYKKYHSNITDSGGYTDQTETKSPLNDDGVEKGEFVHEPSSSPTDSNNDAIEKYPDTSNKPSTTETNVKFSTEKPTSHLETTSSYSKTNTTDTTTNSTSATASKTNDTLKLSLALSFPITQEQALAKPPPSASSPSVVATTTEHILTVHGDVDNENGDDDDVEMPGPNGSITKMTLENNLLIVETEERNDISRVARETKMDYNKDGVFVVEVSRGIDSKTIPESPVTDGNEKMLSMFETKHNNGGVGYKVTNEKNCINNEKVQIHSPPPENAEEGPRSLHQIEEVEEPTNSPHLNENNADDDIVKGLAYKANTGLSQSDLSTTSSSDSNKGYCYGNQELYVVEHSGYSTITPNRNVVLKCDVKDIKDDDRNPGNDHYLKHSPDKKEESKDKQDIVETTKQSQEGNSRTSSGESPAQKQIDKAQEKETNAIEMENIENLQVMETNNSDINKENCVEDLESCNESSILGNPVELPLEKQNFSIPVEIEVHITPAEIEDTKADETPSPVKSESPVLKATESNAEVENIVNAETQYVKSKVLTESPVLNATESITEEVYITPAEIENTKIDETLSPVKSTVTSESPILKATESITEPLVLETLEDTLAVETLLPIDTSIAINNETSTLLAEEDVLDNSIPDDEAIIAVPDKFSDKETPQHDENSIRDTQEDIITLENQEGAIKDLAKELQVEKELIKSESTNGAETKENSSPLTNGNSECKEPKLENNQDKCVTKNLLMSNSNLQMNGANEVEELELAIEENTSNAIQNELNMTESQNGLTQSNEVALTNGADVVKSPQLQNGHAEVEPVSISLTDMENGYDSIMSLPEPPPTTDEQLNSDLSDQQLDSLPPPPPPEIFNLKDLPPPLTNGTADSPQSEESNNFYNTLPPPPPTTLEVTASADTTTTTATNGKVHASPLTPPASPPAHFTNNLHAGLCSQPIAVDVNGS